MAWWLEELFWFTGVIGLFGVFDSFVDKRHKTVVAEYTFGFRDVRLADFELGIIRTMLSFFLCEDESFRWIRLIVFSMLLVPALGMLGFALLASVAMPGQGSPFGDVARVVPSTLDLERWGSFLSFYFILGLACLPGEVWNLIVSRFLYLDRLRTSLWMLAILDLVLSVLLPVVLGGLISWLTPSETWNLVGFLLTLAGGSALWFFLFKLTVIVMGILVRGTVQMTRFNRYTVLYTSAHEAPFSFIGLIVALVALGVRVVS